MANQTRVRVCTLGGEAEMTRLCRALLDNCKWLDDEEEGMPAVTLEQLQRQVAHHAQLEGGDDATFFYDMVCGRPYGDALPETARMSIRRHASGVYTALFTYESETAFQPEDWQRLHMQCGMMPMLALYADWDFGMEKGMKVFFGGKAHDDWNRMGEIWLWLWTQYETGYPPEEAVARLRKLRKTIEREEFDLTIAEILQGCMDNLEDLAAHTSDPRLLAELIAKCREEKDWEGLFVLYCRIAETELWDTDHKGRYLATLQAVYGAWVDAEGEDA